MYTDHATSIEEEVYTKLSEEILLGIRPIGEPLREIALAKSLGVSRTPVRGALQRLAEEGLVTIVANKGAVVAGISAEDLIHVYKIRMRLEGLASRMAAERIAEVSAEDRSALVESVARAERCLAAGEEENLKDLDTAFHSAIYRLADNLPLCRILTDLHRKIKAYRKLSLSVAGRMERSVREHRDILTAVLAGNAEEADRLTSYHIEQAMKNLLSTATGSAIRCCSLPEISSAV